MSSIQWQRIQTYCQTIWGPGDYDIDVETDDWISYYAVVKRDYGTSFGSPLTITGICRSQDHAWRELDRMLGAWATQAQSGRPMTDDETLKIFGGPNGENKPLLKQFLTKMKEKNL
ncbi:hypothetical protein EIK77_005412 [Talaromyces pinophilus]|nr:hypothetical protein EIK77_005412 [Talaromyces pinophilus]